LIGAIQIVDIVHMIVNVNLDKGQNRKAKGKGSSDPDANWRLKHTSKVKIQDGKEEKQTEYSFCYKAHVNSNAETDLIISLKITSGETPKDHHFTSLVDHDLKHSLSLETYTADKVYVDGESHYNLEAMYYTLLFV
jgi:hypothetical protein